MIGLLFMWMGSGTHDSFASLTYGVWKTLNKELLKESLNSYMVSYDDKIFFYAIFGE